MPLENKERFLNAEGVELMIIIMNQKKLYYGSAIRVLDFAMTNYPPACERFVDVMGLKTAFPAFMCGLLRGSIKERLLSKFVENEYEKNDRLMELYMRYSNRVKEESERLNDLEMDEDGKYNRKVDGLYSLFSSDSGTKSRATNSKENNCLSYDYVTDAAAAAAFMLEQRDLDLISMMGTFLISRPMCPRFGGRKFAWL